MEIISRHILFLAIYHVIFFRKWYANPFKMCTSEIASTYFPYWIWAKGKVHLTDLIYYKYPASIPFLSSYYPIHLITSFLSKFLSIDNAFRLFSIQLILHYLLSSIITYFMFLQFYSPEVALFGAITLTYCAYFFRLFTPAAVYSKAWLPGILLGGWIGAFCLGMSILGGYYPILVYMLPFCLILRPESSFGLILGLPQLIPFLMYWPKSIRANQVLDRNWGKVPLWRFLDLLIPDHYHNSINGVFWPEMTMYVGLIPLIACWWSTSRAWVTLLIAFWGALGLIPSIQRIPARWLSLFSLSLIWMAINGLSHLSIPIWPLIIFQSWQLLINADIYPHFPFCQWWQKPSKFFRAHVCSKEWPYFTGYMFNHYHMWYKGGFCLKDSNG